MFRDRQTDISENAIYISHRDTVKDGRVKIFQTRLDGILVSDAASYVMK